MPASTKTLFDLCGGHAALDLVNSCDFRFRADGGAELITSHADLLRFLRESELLGAQAIEEHAGTLEAVRALRETTARVLYGNLGNVAPTPADMATLQRFFLEAGAHRELRWDHGLSWRYPTDRRLPLWLLADAVADVLLTDKLHHIRACAADTCRWLFLDSSKNHKRRWCNMQVCGNRMKARRQRLIHKEARREA